MLFDVSHPLPPSYFHRRAAAPQAPAESAAPRMATAAAFHHTPVLLAEVTALFRAVLQHRPAPRLLDLTVGGGGHAAALLSALPSASLAGRDRDPAAVAAARARLAEFGARASVAQGTWSAAAAAAAAAAPAAPAARAEQYDGVLIDCGVSSHQLDTPERGFSLRREGPLDMRMGGAGGGGVSAGELVRGLPQAALARVLRVYGEEPLAAPIAAALVARRSSSGGGGGGGLSTTTELAAEVARVVARLGSGSGSGGGGGGGSHPATRVFQALRMAVNAEAQELAALLAALPALVAPGGLAVLLTFHSLEDRAVKRALGARGYWQDAAGGARAASAEEVAANPRARSAKLRAARRREL